MPWRSRMMVSCSSSTGTMMVAASIIADLRNGLPRALLDNHALAGELIRGSLQCQHGRLEIGLVDAQGEDGLALPEPGGDANRLPERVAHARAEPVCSGACGQRILPENLMRVDTDTQVERVLPKLLLQQPVGGESRGLDGLLTHLQLPLGDELERDLIVALHVADVKAYNLEVGGRADVGLLPVLGGAGVWPLQMPVRHELPQLDHGSAESRVVFKSC